MNRIKRNKIMATVLVLLASALIVYFLIFKLVLGETGALVGGVLGFFILLAFVGTASKSKQQLDNELKYMSDYHDNHRPRVR